MSPVSPVLLKKTVRIVSKTISEWEHLNTCFTLKLSQTRLKVKLPNQYFQSSLEGNQKPVPVIPNHSQAGFSPKLANDSIPVTI